MSSAPTTKRVVAFFDCQNLYNAAKNLWGYSFPNFDPIKLARLVTESHKEKPWKLAGIRLYTGIHDNKVNPHWHRFWNRKLLCHKTADTRVFYFTSPLRYADGTAREKGVDVRIALDLVKMARKNEYDVAILFSQDNDFSEVVQDVNEIANEHGRSVTIASAYPYENHSNMRGVDKTVCIKISRAEYDSCIDLRDYRIP